MSNKQQVSFNVSARTARLIGRENVATSEGAIIELVKNTYDADADVCIVYFDIPYESAPKTVPLEEFARLSELARTFEIELEDFYASENGLWIKKKLVVPTNCSENDANKVKKKFIQKNNKLTSFFASYTNIYIIDNGEGMDADTIVSKWMTIGTDNKALDFKSSKGRIKSGAKGIGRFALDKLGRHGEMRTITKSSESTLLWNVDWDSFEQKGRNIDEIYATLENVTLKNSDFIKEFLPQNLIDDVNSSIEGESRTSFIDTVATGTIIRVSTVRDHWEEKSLRTLKSGLESLVPPVEDTSFQLFFYNNISEELNGRLYPEICDDYDYKLDVSADSNLNLTINLYRNEFDIGRLPNDLFERDFFKKNNFTKQDFKKEKLTLNKTLGELLPGISESEDYDIEEIGAFSFTLYFLKQNSSKNDRETYYLKEINRDKRKHWLDNNSGVKVFRDNFRVRPYGEQSSAAWDWLGLGSRVALSPAAVSRKGDWRVSPKSVSGVINISRVENPHFQDKSSREGLQESDALHKFKEIILKLINIFENDRSSIYSELRKYWDSKATTPAKEEVSQRDKSKADLIAAQKFEQYKQKQSADSNEKKKKKSDDETLALAYLSEKNQKQGLEKELDHIQKENFLLRIFASSGVTIASFTHELSNLQTKLGDRFNDIKQALLQHVSEEDFADVYRFENPLYMLDLFEKEDRKIKRWLQYTLRTIRKDKRNRKQINITNYFTNYESEWIETLDERETSLQVIDNTSNYHLRAFEIDLDYIFNNLLINSLDAFMQSSDAIEREIKITLNDVDEGLKLIYTDLGPGLSKDISDPQDIFEPTFTTKRDKNGKEVGTGMGMWLIAKTLEEYKATATINSPKKGFEIEFIFPHLYQNKRN